MSGARDTISESLYIMYTPAEEFPASRNGGPGTTLRPRGASGANGAQHRGCQSDLRQIDRLGGVSFLPDGRPKQPPMPTRPAVSFDADIDFIEENESGPGVRRAGADPLD
jgi:hypothetical protein